VSPFDDGDDNRAQRERVQVVFRASAPVFQVKKLGINLTSDLRFYANQCVPLRIRSSWYTYPANALPELERASRLHRKGFRSKSGHILNRRFIKADILEVFDYESGSFDSVISTYAIHHLTDEEKRLLFGKVLLAWFRVAAQCSAI